jgi:hypothetical protein
MGRELGAFLRIILGSIGYGNVCALALRNVAAWYGTEVLVSIVEVKLEVDCKQDVSVRR